MTAHKLGFAIPLMLSLTGCAAIPPMQTVDHVDLERFMGDWYVIANIPTFLEKGAHNAVESYRLNDDGTIATTFTFLAGGFDGKLRTFRPTGFVQDTQTNALWGMQFVWPIKADFRVIWLDDEYRHTIIGRAKRDYVWIMAREPSIADELYEEMVVFLDGIGYDTDLIQQVPQQWDDPAVNAP